MTSKDKIENHSANKLSKNNQSPDLAATVRDNIAETDESASPLLVPVTAIGASAGGLEPIEQFFDAMPIDSGSAIVVIQHLSPEHISLMDELLSRRTSMKIKKIVDGTMLMPNSIYLNSPRSVMTVDGNYLRVTDVVPQQLVNLPIDIFFESLAANRGADSIGIVLSGTGSDGTKGSIAITEAGGKVLVQDPDTTQFEGMPRSVLDHGKSMLSASPAVLANSVVRLLKNERIDDIDPKKRESISEPFADVMSMLKHCHGADFQQYKTATIHRRIERRAQMRRIRDINDYRNLLLVDINELNQLYDDLLIEVTEFFRDKAAFEALEKFVIPKLIDELPDHDVLRVWVPGCASGEEAYSIAILLQEYGRKSGKIVPIKIMATDIHSRSMSKASSGIYDESALRNIPKEIADRYFDQMDGKAQVKQAMRRMVFFSTHDVTADPPFVRTDLVSCRNLLIYLKDSTQKSVMKLLHFSLRKGGFLFLGSSENIASISREFETVSDKCKIYRKLRDVKLASAESVFSHNKLIGKTAIKNVPIVESKSMPADETIQFKQAHRDALEEVVREYAPPGFLLDEDGVVAHIFGGAGDLIPMQAGVFSRRLVDLIKPELKVFVISALEQGRLRDFSGFRRSAYVRSTTGKPVNYEIELKKVGPRGRSPQFRLLTIEVVEQSSDDVQQSALFVGEELPTDSTAEELRQLNKELVRDLQVSEESLQSTIEELETSNEELQSTNEELMSSNEELQSTNEELHSVNEELYTVSSEHQRKNEELTERDTDIDLLLRESKIGTIHLDSEMRLRRYSNIAKSIFNLLPQDIGRPMQHLAIHLSADDDLFGMAERANAGNETLETKVELDETVFLIRVTPYHPQEFEPSGVVITIIDITEIENISAELASLNSNYSKLAEKTNTGLLHWDAKTSLIKHCNSLFAKARGCSIEDIVGMDVWSHFPAEGRENYKQLVSEMKPDEVKSVVLDLVDAFGRSETKNISIHAISHDGVNIHEYQSIGQDITDEAHYNKALEKLFLSFDDGDLGFKAKIDKMLKVGIDYLGMESAVVGMASGDFYQIKNVIGLFESKLKVSDTVPVRDTFALKYMETQGYFAVESVSQSTSAGSVLHSKLEMESYIGAVINANRKPYGTVFFASSDSVNRPFTSQHKSFTMLISGWIGSLVSSAVVDTSNKDHKSS